MSFLLKNEVVFYTAYFLLLTELEGRSHYFPAIWLAPTSLHAVISCFLNINFVTILPFTSMSLKRPFYFRCSNYNVVCIFSHLDVCNIPSHLILPFYLLILNPGKTASLFSLQIFSHENIM
jgi:hypothetical protein